MDARKPRIAILSLRSKNNFVFNSCLYEFEDIITEVSDADLIKLNSTKNLEILAQKVVKKSAEYVSPFTKVIPPLNPTITLEKEYDLLFIIVDFPYNILNINFLQKWRQKSKIAICYIVELWKTELKKFENYLTFLNHFDYIFLGHSQITKEVESLAKKPCAYLAPASDTLKFHPKSLNSYRSIDICSMGRRSSLTHEALLKRTEQGNFFYHYDALNSSNLYIQDHQAHRIFNANVLKNSRYFITHQAKINCFEQTGGQIEIGYRFFEGAAAGCVLLGTPPKNDVFDKYLGWQHSVIPVKFDEPDIAQIIAELDNQPELLRKISSDNVRNSLLINDWIYRWEQILTTIGLPTNDKIDKRKYYLQQIADQFEIA